MSLKDLLPSPVTVKVGKNTLTLNPLTLTDLILLSKSHYPELAGLMEGKTSNLNELLVKSPHFCGHLIAISSGNPDEADVAMKLPFSVQLLALKGIWDASMVEEEAMGKFVVSLANGVARLNGLLKENALKLPESLSPPAPAGT